MSTLAANETRRQVRYDYTPTERIAKATGLAEALNRYTATENEKKRIAKDYDSRLDIIQAEIDQLNGSVLSGYELREYLCFWTYDEPRAGRKTLRKREGGDIIAEEDMTERDRQMVMEILDAQAAAANAGEPLAIAANMMPRTVAEVTLADEAVESFHFKKGVCLAYGAAFSAVFVNYLTAPFSLHDDASREVALTALFQREATWLQGFAEWLNEEPRASIPGAHWLACAVDAHLKGERIKADAERAKAAAAKTAARKGRRASSAGTVDCPADEGSRDDSGPDSKNNL